MNVVPYRWIWNMRRALWGPRPEHINALELSASLDAVQQVGWRPDVSRLHDVSDLLVHPDVLWVRVLGAVVRKSLGGFQ